MTKVSKTKVIKKVKAKAKAASARVTQIRAMAPPVGEPPIEFNNGIFNQHLSEVMAIIANSRALKGPVAYKIFLLCSKLDVVAPVVRDSITKIMLAHAKDKDPNSKFEVVDRAAYDSEMNAFLSEGHETDIQRFEVEDFANVGLSPNDYSTIKFLF